MDWQMLVLDRCSCDVFIQQNRSFEHLILQKMTYLSCLLTSADHQFALSGVLGPTFLPPFSVQSSSNSRTVRIGYGT